ncbi:hypothetical protein PMLGA01_060006700 [Plasmodium malariae]|uniref:Uncharacterized protein n=1 Tax=Plasmodium malariae TaxID=5858 RepID=A0A1C3KAV9_PLAMA|nr:hypothetical protein PMLGA01_060006700 [Plasmodium malariae]
MGKSKISKEKRMIGKRQVPIHTNLCILFATTQGKNTCTSTCEKINMDWRNFSPCQSNLSNHIGYSFINNINAQNSKRKYSMLIQNPKNVVYNINLMEKKEQMLYFNITREEIVRPLFLLFIFANGINC